MCPGRQESGRVFPKLKRAALRSSGQAQLRFVSTALYAAITLAMVLGAWNAFGRDTDALSLRAIACALIAGAIIGFFSVRWLRETSKNKAIVVGIVGGLLLHVLTWIFFAAWAWLAAWAGPETLDGSLFDSVLAGIFWSVGSISFGFWFTCPCLVIAAMIVRHLDRSEDAPDSPD